LTPHGVEVILFKVSASVFFYGWQVRVLEEVVTMKSMTLILTVGLAIVFSGCTTKRVEGGKVPVKKTTAQKKSTEKKSIAGSVAHEVVKGDTLWGISGMEKAYADHMQWPLLFKYNRDIIQDPDLIYPGQNLQIKKDVSDEEVSKARKAASDTPVYRPHTTPRETLPVDYF
jgi:LysM repeat protein